MKVVTQITRIVIELVIFIVCGVLKVFVL